MSTCRSRRSASSPRPRSRSRPAAPGAGGGAGRAGCRLPDRGLEPELAEQVARQLSRATTPAGDARARGARRQPRRPAEPVGGGRVVVRVLRARRVGACPAVPAGLLPCCSQPTLTPRVALFAGGVDTSRFTSRCALYSGSRALSAGPRSPLAWAPAARRSGRRPSRGRDGARRSPASAQTAAEPYLHRRPAVLAAQRQPPPPWASTNRPHHVQPDAGALRAPGHAALGVRNGSNSSLDYAGPAWPLVDTAIQTPSSSRAAATTVPPRRGRAPARCRRGRRGSGPAPAARPERGSRADDTSPWCERVRRRAPHDVRGDPMDVVHLAGSAGSPGRP